MASSTKPESTLIQVYNGLAVAGFIMNVIILLTAAVSRRIRRSSNWYLFMSLWVWWCIVYFILVGHQEGPEPPFGLCLMQSALTYGAPPANAFATLCILLQIYHCVVCTINQKPVNNYFYLLLMYLPPVVYIAIFLEILVMGLGYPDSVEREASGMYCHLSNGLPIKISATLVIIACVLMLTFEGMTFRLLYLHRNYIRSLTRGSSIISVTIIVRVSVFSLLPMIALAISVKSGLSSDHRSDPGFNLGQASLPVAAALIFGTQRDLLQTWMFWKDGPMDQVRPTDPIQQVQTPAYPLAVQKRVEVDISSARV